MNPLTEQQKALHRAQSEWHRILSEGKVPEWRTAQWANWKTTTPYWDEPYLPYEVREHIPPQKMVRVEGTFLRPAATGLWDVCVEIIGPSGVVSTQNYYKHPSQEAAEAHFRAITTCKDES